MNEELKRIRSKDFSQLDEKIYEDKHRADNLDATLLHLTDFQKFLIEQIANLDKNQPNTKSNLIAKSIARNFDHLKESLVKCSRIQDRCVKEKIIGLRENLQYLKKQLKQTKHALQEQTKMAQIINNERMKNRVDVQTKKNDDLEKKYQQILAQNKQLKKQNLQLKIVAAQPKEAIVNKIQQCIIGKTHTEGNQRAPLRQAVFFQNPVSNNITQGEVWKANRNQASQGLLLESFQKRSASLKRQTSNHQLSRKSHINCLRDKQNEALKSKGIVVQEIKRGKSKQKIKLVSFI